MMIHEITEQVGAAKVAASASGAVEGSGQRQVPRVKRTEGREESRSGWSLPSRPTQGGADAVLAVGSRSGASRNVRFRHDVPRGQPQGPRGTYCENGGDTVDRCSRWPSSSLVRDTSDLPLKVLAEGELTKKVKIHGCASSPPRPSSRSAMLAVYRIGFWIPVPGIDQEELARQFERQGEDQGAGSPASASSCRSSPAARSRTRPSSAWASCPTSPRASSSSSSAPVVPPQEASGRRSHWPPEDHGVDPLRHRRTLHRAGFGWLGYITSRAGLRRVRPATRSGGSWASAALTAGTVFLMWLGEQIDKHGIGNGVSMIIMAGILGGMPDAISGSTATSSPATPTRSGTGHHRPLFLSASSRDRRLGPHDRRPAAHPDPAGQAHPRPPRLRRAEAATCPSASTTAA
jgi:hypothetical protein